VADPRANAPRGEASTDIAVRRQFPKLEFRFPRRRSLLARFPPPREPICGNMGDGEDAGQQSAAEREEENEAVVTHLRSLPASDL